MSDRHVSAMRPGTLVNPARTLPQAAAVNKGWIATEWRRNSCDRALGVRPSMCRSIPYKLGQVSHPVIDAALLDSVARATAHRDRDDLDVSVVQMLAAVLSVRAIRLYRLLDEGSRQRGWLRVEMIAGRIDGPHDYEDFGTLPIVDANRSWRRCISRLDVEQGIGRDGAFAVFPMLAERHVVGFLEVATEQPLVARECELVRGLLRIVRNHLALLDYGERDTLTGLLNRKTFEASFSRLRARVRERAREPASGEPSWLCVADIDRFKSINDRYGHLFGDEVLLLIARLMERNFRGADQLFRFGGEEFVIVLDRATTEGAHSAFERLRKLVESHVFPRVGRVTISLGYTRIDAVDSAAASFDRADAALYRAKHAGRNRVSCYEALLASGAIAARDIPAEVEFF